MLSCVRIFATPWNAAHQASLFFTISKSLFMSIELMMPSNHLILFCPLLLLPSIFPSIRVFSSVSALPTKWPKYLSFSFSISLSNEYSGLIFFRIDWFDLLAVQGTLNSLLQHHNSKASILLCSAFIMVQLSHSFIYFCSVAQSVQLFVTPWTAARQASLSFMVSWSLLKLMSIELSMMPSNHLFLCGPLLLCLQSFFFPPWEIQ